ncbi:MAG: hypothetical protein KAJ40_06245 [Alphaproteobacteria bacterium]|nr:hypothetical protein [Alphaproteobacteria bacterium]
MRVKLMHKNIYNKCHKASITFLLSFAAFMCAGAVVAHQAYAQGFGGQQKPSSVYVSSKDKDVRIGQSTAFFAGYRDIPIMLGLVEMEDASFTYDKPEGDIIEIVARFDSVSPEQVLRYYEIVLPQFGWNKVSEGGHYYRQGEYLDLAFDKCDSQSVFKIMIHPSR